jgi:hypothetical protein
MMRQNDEQPPTPTEIAERAALIREGWDEIEHRKRAGLHAEPFYEVERLKISDNPQALKVRTIRTTRTMRFSTLGVNWRGSEGESGTYRGPSTSSMRTPLTPGEVLVTLATTSAAKRNLCVEITVLLPLLSMAITVYPSISFFIRHRAVLGRPVVGDFPIRVPTKGETVKIASLKNRTRWA